MCVCVTGRAHMCVSICVRVCVHAPCCVCANQTSTPNQMRTVCQCVCVRMCVFNMRSCVCYRLNQNRTDPCCILRHRYVCMHAHSRRYVPRVPSLSRDRGASSVQSSVCVHALRNVCHFMCVLVLSCMCACLYEFFAPIPSTQSFVHALVCTSPYFCTHTMRERTGH
jgi:hypothetical protein